MPETQLPQVRASDVFTTPLLHELQESVKARESDLKKLRKKLDNAGLDNAVANVDDALKMIKGDGPTRPGLKAWLGVATEEQDPAQTTIEGIDEGEGGDERWDDVEPDRRSWKMTVSELREEIADICGQPPAIAVRTLTAIEKGEKDRDHGPRSSALEEIRSARSKMAEKAGAAVAAGGEE